MAAKVERVDEAAGNIFVRGTNKGPGFSASSDGRIVTLTIRSPEMVGALIAAMNRGGARERQVRWVADALDGLVIDQEAVWGRAGFP